MKSVAINVGADGQDPVGRGPIFADGSFMFVPVPEPDPTVDEPTYDDLGLANVLPTEMRDEVAHFDPEFPEIGFGERYTFGHGQPPESGAIRRLEAGDVLLFYAELEYRDIGQPHRDWIDIDWGVYLIGHFILARDPVSMDEAAELPTDERRAFRNNAHVRAENDEVEVLVLGEPRGSALYDEAIPLSDGEAIHPSPLVTVHSTEVGSGPWYRRPIQFDDTATRWILDRERQTKYETVHG